MSGNEFRQDPISKSWSIIAPKRSTRPNELKKAGRRGGTKETEKEGSSKTASKVVNPFAEGNESMTPKETMRIGKGKPGKPGWEVRVFPNKFPLTDFHEVVVHSPDEEKSFHNLPVSHIEKILKVYKLRYEFYQSKELFPFIFVNSGRASGASLAHPHSQIVVFDEVPEIVLEEAMGAKEYHERDSRDVFGEVIQTEVDLGERVVAITDYFIVLCPYASEWPFEINIFPKRPVGSFHKSSEKELRDLAAILSKVAGIMKEELGDPSYNFWIHSIPDIGKFKELSSIYRWHIELILRTKILGPVELGAGVMVDDKISPEDAAKFYRKHYK